MDGGIRLLAGILIWGQRLPEGYIGKNQFFFLYYHYLSTVTVIVDASILW